MKSSKMVNVTSWGKDKQYTVTDRMRMAQDLMKLAQGIKASALAVFGVEQEEGVRDFLVDMLLSNPDQRPGRAPGRPGFRVRPRCALHPPPPLT